MTQTSPKPTDQKASDSHDAEASRDGHLDSPTTELTPDSTPKATLRLSPEIKKPFWQKLRLRTKVMMLAITLGTAPVIAIGTVAYNIADQQLIKQIQQDKIDAADALNEEVSQFLLERYVDIQVLADLPILRDPQERATITRQQKQEILSSFQRASRVYDSIVVVDLSGHVILQTSSGKVATDYSAIDYFKEAIKTNRPVITSPRKSTSSNKYSIFTAAPVKDSITGKTIAVVRARVPIEVLQKLIEHYGKGSNEFLIAGADGKIFVAEKAKEVGKRPQDLFRNFAKLQAAQKPDTTLDTNLLDNKRHIFGYAPLRRLEGLPDLKWSTVISQPTNDAYAPQYLLLWSLGIGTAVTALLVTALAAYLANRATRPILSASNAVQKLGQGKLDTRLTVAGDDELAVLGSNINLMADQMQLFVRNQAAETERTRLFAEIASAQVSEAQEMQPVFNKAVAGAREILSVDRVVVYRFNPDWSGYVTAESVANGWPQALVSKIEDSCIGDQLIEAYRNGRVVPTENVFEAGFHPEHLQLMERLQIKANLVTPIVNNSQLFGLLVAHHCQHTHVWQQSEINFLTQLASQLGLILDCVRLLEQQQAETERAQIVKDITVKLAQLPQVERVFDTAVQEIRLALKSDRVVVYGFNDKWQGTVVAEAVAEGWPQALGAKIDDPCFAQKYVERYRRGRVQATENIYTAGLNECYLKQLKQFAVKANLVAPILQSGQLLGLLIAHQCSAPRAWQQSEIDLFAQLATQVGFALDRAGLLEQQKTAKELLQRRALELLMEVDPISRGDLTIRANVTEDEIGTIADSYNSTVTSLRKLVTQVQTAATQVATTTSSNEVSVSELSQEALRQAQEIAVTLERIQGMTNSLRAVAVNAEQAEAAVQQATQTVEAGDAAMNRTVAGILAIRETVAVTSKKVKRLGESSQKISKVVNLIGTFANQTNLLALNAAIEAANAGEQGRGFAVVADQVRTLARQSAQATAEIESLVMEIQTETNEVVAAMEAGTVQVVEGTKLVGETRQSLNKITAVSSQISALVAAITAAAAAQSQTSVAVSQSISDVAAIANQNSNEATLVSASFKELLAVATELQASVGKFKVN